MKERAAHAALSFRFVAAPEGPPLVPGEIFEPPGGSPALGQAPR